MNSKYFSIMMSGVMNMYSNKIMMFMCFQASLRICNYIQLQDPIFICKAQFGLETFSIDF